MRIAYFWPKKEKDLDYYIVEIHKTEHDSNDLIFDGSDFKHASITEEDFSQNNRWQIANPYLASHNCVYILVSADLKDVAKCPIQLPYAGQWNGPNPLIKIPDMLISSLSEIKNLSEQIFESATSSLIWVRSAFEHLAAKGIISGNDNHIGDIGEYYAMAHFRDSGKPISLSGTKVSRYDFVAADQKISVKTLTPWSKTGKGTRLKFNGEWDYLFLVKLNAQLFPDRMASIHVDALKTRLGYKPGQTPPQVMWWPWLNDYEISS